MRYLHLWLIIEALADSKLYGKVIRGYRENADARRGKDQLFQTDEFANFLGGKFFSNFETEHHTKLETWASFGNELSHIGIKGKVGWKGRFGQIWFHAE